MFVATDGTLEYHHWNNNLNVPSVIKANTRHHVVTTYNASTNVQSVYVDGVLAGSRTASTDFVGTPAIYVASIVGNTWERWIGGLDDVRVYDAALTSGQVEDLYIITKYASSEDCNDSNASINPLLTTLPIWYADPDGDGYSSGGTMYDCTDPGAIWYSTGQLTSL